MGQIWYCSRGRNLTSIGSTRAPLATRPPGHASSKLAHLPRLVFPSRLVFTPRLVFPSPWSMLATNGHRPRSQCSGRCLVLLKWTPAVWIGTPVHAQTPTKSSHHVPLVQEPEERGRQLLRPAPEPCRQLRSSGTAGGLRHRAAGSVAGATCR